MSSPAPADILTPALVARAERVVHPWSGASIEERQRARLILQRASARHWRPYTEAIIERDPPPAPRRGRFWLFGR